MSATHRKPRTLGGFFGNALTNLLSAVAIVISIISLVNSNHASQKANNLTETSLEKQFSTNFKVSCYALQTNYLIIDINAIWMNNAASCTLTNLSSKTITIGKVTGSVLGSKGADKQEPVWIRSINSKPAYDANPDFEPAEIYNTYPSYYPDLTIQQGEQASLQFNTYIPAINLTSSNWEKYLNCASDMPSPSNKTFPDNAYSSFCAVNKSDYDNWQSIAEMPSSTDGVFQFTAADGTTAKSNSFYYFGTDGFSMTIGVDGKPYDQLSW